MTRPKNVINTEDLPWTEGGDGQRDGKFTYQRKSFTQATSGEKLGCSLLRVPPGKTAFPAHQHHANEEAIYILAGAGTLRLGGERHPVGAGDYIALPPGVTAHQLINTGHAALEYLCFSTMIPTEVVEYADSGKVLAMAGGAPGGDKAGRSLFQIYKRGSEVDYYEGE